MDFALTLIANFDKQKSNLVDSLSDYIEEYFAAREYGRDVKSYTIGIISVPEDYEHIFESNLKPRYTRGKKINNSFGIPVTIEDSLEYSITVNYIEFTSANVEDSISILSSEILRTLSVVNPNKLKIIDFDFKSFEEDLKDCLQKFDKEYSLG